MLSNTIRRMASQRVAVILAGSGVYDGTEVHEASAALVAVSRANAQVKTTKLKMLTGFNGLRDLNT